MKLLLTLTALVAIAYSAPVEKSKFPLAVGGIELLPALNPRIDINISINGIVTPYDQQNLVYIEVRNPTQPPQLAKPGFDYIPDNGLLPVFEEPIENRIL